MSSECCVNPEGPLSPSTPPAGEFATLGGVRTLTVRGSASGRGRRALVLLTDIFGVDAHALHANAGRMAAAGGGELDVIVPDICLGDPFPHDRDFSHLGDWFAVHHDAAVTPVVAASLAAVRALGYEKVACLGYCWGARASVLAGQARLVDGFAVAHPSKCEAADFASVSLPALFILAEVDNAFAQTTADAAIADLRARGFAVAVSGPHAGTVHGFAARGDEEVPAVAAARKAGIEAAVKFTLGL